MEWDGWQQVAGAPFGHVFADFMVGGYRVLVRRCSWSLGAYVGVPLAHPLAGRHCDELPLAVHGDLNFSSEGGGDWPSGWWWYGWDYGHHTDRTVSLNDHVVQMFADLGFPLQIWTVPDVCVDAELVAEQLAFLTLVSGLQKRLPAPEATPCRGT